MSRHSTTLRRSREERRAGTRKRCIDLWWVTVMCGTERRRRLVEWGRVTTAHKMETMLGWRFGGGEVIKGAWQMRSMSAEEVRREGAAAQGLN